MKNKKIDLNLLDAVEVYKLLLDGNIKRFPKGFWQRPDAINNACKCIEYLIEVKLKLKDNQLKEQLSTKLFVDNGLGGMLQICFNFSAYNAINETYPNKFKEWEFKQVPNKFWTKEKGIEAIRWLIQEKLKLSDKELKEQLSTKLFVDNGLGSMLQICFNFSAYNAINTVYPDKFKEWEFKVVPKNFWTKEKTIEATRWLIEEELKLSDKELIEQLSYKLFVNNGLGGMLYNWFNNSPFAAIKSAYPNKF